MKRQRLEERKQNNLISAGLGWTWRTERVLPRTKSDSTLFFFFLVNHRENKRDTSIVKVSAVSSYAADNPDIQQEKGPLTGSTQVNVENGQWRRRFKAEVWIQLDTECREQLHEQPVVPSYRWILFKQHLIQTHNQQSAAKPTACYTAIHLPVHRG